MRHFTLLIKPSGPDCNLDCQYCFYSCKADYFGPGAHRMTDDVARVLVRDYLDCGFEVNSFAWQGGEPMLMGLDFYKRIVELQQQHGKDGQAVTNALQTNGTLLDDTWCEFLHEYKWLVGISLDGPKKYHDHYRLDHAGKGTYDRVMAGINACRKNRVEFNILVLLNDVNVKHPDELFDFFSGLGIRFLQFIPCVERSPDGDGPADFAVTPESYADFMCRIFDRWLDHGPEKISIRLFDSVLHYMVNGAHTECTLGRKCNDYIVIEHNGDAFCCDFFVGPDYKLGNITDENIAKLAASKIKRNFSKKKTKLNNKCLVCRHKDICRGGCLKDRILLEGDFAAPSYLCDGYKKFFDQTLGRFAALRSKIGS